MSFWGVVNDNCLVADLLYNQWQFSVTTAFLVLWLLFISGYSADTTSPIDDQVCEVYIKQTLWARHNLLIWGRDVSRTSVDCVCLYRPPLYVARRTGEVVRQQAANRRENWQMSKARLDADSSHRLSTYFIHRTCFFPHYQHYTA
jgi:hypothetical protein